MRFSRTTFRMMVLAAGLVLGGVSQAQAWQETQNGTTYDCQEIKSTQCTADSKGNLTNCHDVKKVKCTAIKGPGSGNAAMGNFPDEPKNPEPNGRAAFGMKGMTFGRF